MNEHGFGTTISVKATPLEAFAAINDVRGWWGHDVEGSTDTVGDEFTYYGEDVHRSVIRVIDLVPGERVVWHVLDNWMSFVEDQSEWRDTRIVFEVSATDDGAEIRFSHLGLVPAYECYDVCRNAWTFFVEDSLPSLIATGVGKPLLKKRTA